MSAQSNLSIRGARLEYADRFRTAINTFRVVCELDRLNGKSDERNPAGPQTLVFTACLSSN